MSNLDRALAQQYTKEIVRTPRGRAMLLSSCADAEDSGESRLFDRLAARVEDAKLQQLIRRHQEDEIRHGRLFREAAARVGVPLEPVPENLKIIDRLNVDLDGVFDRPIVSDLDVMEAYLLLQVLEERAVTQFPMFERVFRDVDPATADTFAVVAKDEERHLKYCHAISRRYAPDEATLAATLKEFREAEAVAFGANNRAVMDYSLENDLVEMGPLKRGAWRSIRWLADRVSQRQTTPFWYESPAAAAA